MRASVREEGRSYQPEVLFWVNEEGTILGHVAGKPGTLYSLAGHAQRLKPIECLCNPVSGLGMHELRFSVFTSLAVLQSV
jgi:hypothetical protein